MLKEILKGILKRVLKGKLKKKSLAVKNFARSFKTIYTLFQKTAARNASKTTKPRTRGLAYTYSEGELMRNPYSQAV